MCSYKWSYSSRTLILWPKINSCLVIHLTYLLISLYWTFIWMTLLLTDLKYNLKWNKSQHGVYKICRFSKFTSKKKMLWIPGQLLCGANRIHIYCMKELIHTLKSLKIYKNGLVSISFSFIFKIQNHVYLLHCMDVKLPHENAGIRKLNFWA